MDREPVIYCFSHIPKTAGTSLNALLRGYFGLRGLSVMFRPDAPQREYRQRDLVKDLKCFPHVRFLSGHALKPFADFGQYEHRMRWFTFLRNPEKRFISLYVHQQTGGLPAYSMDLVDWAEQFDRANGMVQMIAGEQNLSKAIDILEEKFSFVGLTEEYERSIAMMKHLMHFDSMRLTTVEKKMQSRNNSISSAIYSSYDKYRECIEKNNELDSGLYEYVRTTIWKKQTDQYVSSPENFNVDGELMPNFNRAMFGLQNKIFYSKLLKLGML